jgi:hypothetical protein
MGEGGEQPRRPPSTHTLSHNHSSPGVHTRALQPMATSSPPPSATPWMAATVGLGPPSSTEQMASLIWLSMPAR